MSQGHPKRFEILNRRRLSDGALKLDEVTVRFETFAGGMTEPMKREVVRRQDASVALVRHRSRGTLVFVDQFRMASADKGGGWVTEICAGKLDAGETAEQAMRRELREETGYEALSVEPVTSFFVSPGYTDERMHLFLVEVDGEPGPKDEDEFEDICLVELTPEESFRWADDGRFADSKTLLALYWLRSRAQ
ncbi:MAG: NUDIX domain-containing protein [Alphaproteobacteria bacterium]|nr:NUDIX domain-containing protein [Alphaproteobacteria bacterium]